MGYQEALEAAGAVVKDFKEFGSYQGTWIAILSDGRLVEGYYGSCSGCDAYQAEFGYSDEPRLWEGKYYKDNRICEDALSNLEEYEKDLAAYKLRLAKFGQSYLNEAQSFEQALNRYQVKIDEDYAWEDDREIYNWLKTKA